MSDKDDALHFLMHVLRKMVGRRVPDTYKELAMQHAANLLMANIAIAKIKRALEKSDE